jgi:NAD(P)-dependent dehydrogenase (short-subunit alcohol dehydrogenase family)
MARIVITGTSSGIGFELAVQAAEMGHEVLALSRNTSPLSTLNKEGIHTIPFDITSSKDLSKAVSFVQKNWEGSFDILINNAGSLVNKPFTNLSIEDFRAVYEVNVFGVAALTNLLLPFINKKGNVLNISSVGGVQGSVKFPGLAAYSSSKGALITLTELLAEEYKEHGPAFNVAALGAVRTEMLSQAFPDYEAKTTASEMAEYLLDFCLNRASLFNGKIISVSNSTP